MAKMKAKIRSDIGDPGVHHKYGALKPGTTIEIDEEDFGDGLFERPSSGWLSPHEQKDKARAAEEKQRVGNFDPPEEKKTPAGKAEKNGGE